MTAEEETERSPIVPPAGKPLREAVRSAAEATVELIPGAAIVTGLLRTTHPPASAKETELWQEAISDRTNEHTARLDTHEALLEPTETITGLPAVLIARLVQECPDGMARRYYDLDALCALLPDADRTALNDAAFDLKALNLLKSRHYFGGWQVALAEGAYAQIDPQVMEWDTQADAIEIARLMIAEDSGHAPELHEKLGWSKRRFNPAFRLLLPLFPEGRVSKEMQPHYPSLGVSLAYEDKAKLRRLVAKADGGR